MENNVGRCRQKIVVILQPEIKAFFCTFANWILCKCL